MTPDELVGHVMMEMIASVGMENLTPDDNHALNVMARAAIAVALEEAALICERRFMGDHTREDMEARRCAAAIRAMIPKDEA